MRCLYPARRRARQQQGAFPTVAGKGGCTFELGAGFMYAVEPGEQVTANAG